MLINSVHTPGPWHKVRVFVDNNTDQIQIHSAASRFGSPDCVAVLGGWLEGTGMQNANLICAAPELLEAAKFLLQTFELNMDDVEKYTRSRIEAMQRAIAKAEGQS